jgi:hypothetical protein
MLSHSSDNNGSENITSENTSSRSTKHGRPRRLLLKSGVFFAVAGLAIGGGFAINSEVVAQERVAAVAEAEVSATAAADREHNRLLTNLAKGSASATLDDANTVLAANSTKVDTTALAEVTSSLASFEILPLSDIESLTAEAQTETASVEVAATEADRIAAEAAAAEAAAQAAAEAAAAEAAAAEAAAQAAAQAAAAEEERQVRTSNANTPNGARAVAADLASSKYGWGSGQFECLDNLWQKESGWNYAAVNSSSGATGIPQALPGSKMASAGNDWATNATTQISWGLEYISSSRYGTPCAAWSHSVANNWY